MAEEKIEFEKSLKRLEEIVAKVESETLPLEESLTCSTTPPPWKKSPANNTISAATAKSSTSIPSNPWSEGPAPNPPRISSAAS